LECWEEHTKGFGYCAKDLIHFLELLSFQGFVLAERGGKVFLTRVSSKQTPRELENIVFVRDASILIDAGFEIQKESEPN